MTVIAWDGRSLAGDRMRQHDGTPTPCRKVFWTPYGVFGCAGSGFDVEAYRRWAQGLVPRPDRLENLLVLFVDTSRRAWVMTEQLVWVPVDMPRWAIGSGADYALGAMEAGADAMRAVEIASKLDAGCGMGVDVVRL